jgi:hypothetical protein
MRVPMDRDDLHGFGDPGRSADWLIVVRNDGEPCDRTRVAVFSSLRLGP